jgi:hypothetical protein
MNRQLGATLPSPELGKATPVNFPEKLFVHYSRHLDMLSRNCKLAGRRDFDHKPRGTLAVSALLKHVTVDKSTY